MIQGYFQNGFFRAHGIRLTARLVKSEYLTARKFKFAYKIGDDLYVSSAIYSLITEAETYDDFRLVMDSIKTVDLTNSKTYSLRMIADALTMEKIIVSECS